MGNALETTKSGRIEDIEVLRAWAILFTIAHHVQFLWTWKSHQIDFVYRYFTFWGGVDLFFAISGFVIARDLLTALERSDYQQGYWAICAGFWIKRMFRIWPTSWLWLFILVMFSIVFRQSGAFVSVQWQLSDVTASIMQVQNIHFLQCFQGATKCGDASSWWSLSLEEQFYIALPIGAFVFRKKLPLFLLAAVAVQILIPRGPWTFYWAIRTDAICLGVLLAYFSRTPLYAALNPRFLAKRSYALPFAMFMLFLLATVPDDWRKVSIGSLSTGLLAIVSVALVFVASFNGNYLCRPGITKKIVLWIGSRSYSLYIIHYPMVLLTHALWKKFDPSAYPIGQGFALRYTLTCLGLSFVLAEANYRWLEIPLRRRGRIIAARIEGLNPILGSTLRHNSSNAQGSPVKSTVAL
jgi:peptidoglycan/LPS O-acetylase OafA/YrhL